jgi:photosynthetic reaction center cytochrome c subunit
MKLAFRGLVVAAAAIAGSSAFLVVSARAQAAGQQGTEQKPPMAEDVFKNVQILRGIPVDEFMETMGFFSAATGLNCQDCHVGESGGDWTKYADDTRRKATARRMLAMVTALNRANFGGRPVVSCWSCHRGNNLPEVVPDLAVQYSNALPRDPFEIKASSADAPSIDAVLGKYIQALGGAQRLATLQSLIVKGTYSGWDTLNLQAPIELFLKAPDQRTTIVHAFDGDTTTVYDGRAGWVAAPETMKPVPVLALTGGNLDAAKIEAQLFFPSRIKEMLTEWRVGLTTTIDDREAQLVQGKVRPGGLPVTLYFDSTSDLLVRVLLYTSSPVGVNPRQIDFADYREVAGIKMPFRWTATWTDGKSTMEVAEIQPNATIDASRFAKPPASKAVTRRNQ